jgi:lipopolysaccharide/colanic/teichoic acid biosynthesis glycosyltransferase
MEQSAKLVLKSVLTSTQYNATLSDVAAKIDQATKAQSENPLNFITDIFKNMTWTTAAIMGGIVLAIILVIAAPFILISIAAKSGGAALSTMGGSAAAAVILG